MARFRLFRGSDALGPPPLKRVVSRHSPCPHDLIQRQTRSLLIQKIGRLIRRSATIFTVGSARRELSSIAMRSLRGHGSFTELGSLAWVVSISRLSSRMVR